MSGSGQLTYRSGPQEKRDSSNSWFRNKTVQGKIRPYEIVFTTVVVGDNSVYPTLLLQHL